MRQIRIVLDTNIYISAFLSKGLASEILQLGYKQKVELFISPIIIQELRQKLRNKFKLSQGDINEFVGLVRQATTTVKPTKKVNIIKTDPQDNIILECALEADAKIIVSMDKHLTKLKSFQDIAIVHPKTLTWIIPKLLV